METNESNQPLTNGVFQLTMEIFSEEQNAHTKSIHELAQTVKMLAEKTDKTTEQAMPAPAIDTAPLAEEIRIGTEKIRQAVAEKPMSITRKFQILLFPEQDRKLFYKIVFGRWLLLLVVMLLLNNLYKFGVHWNNNKKEIVVRQIENDRIRKAWDTLYMNGNKRTRASMEEVYNRMGRKEKKSSSLY